MSITSEQELEALRRVGQIVARCMHQVATRLEPGMTTKDLDAIGRTFLQAHGARPGPEAMYNFPGALCISVNEEVAHGIPGMRRIQPGDLVNIDVSAELGGYYGDTGGSFIVPPADSLKSKVCAAAQSAMWKGIAQARHGTKLNRIGRAIESEAKRHGMTVIRNLCSHGIGRRLHEAPDAIPGYYDTGDKRVLREGTVLTVEPFVSTGGQFAEDAGDGWTLVNPGQWTAQYEHTIVVTRGAPLVLTAL